MICRWFKIFNITEFNALDMVSKTYVLNLEGLGQKSILATKGVTHGITYEGVFLSVGMINRYPFAIDGHAVYLDADMNVYLGIEVPSEN